VFGQPITGAMVKQRIAELLKHPPGCDCGRCEAAAMARAGHVWQTPQPGRVPPLRYGAYRGTRNLRAVQVLLGHTSIATTERYTAVDDSEIRAAMVAAVGD
jgi:integrase